MGLSALAIRRISGPGLLSKHLKRIGQNLAEARAAGKCILLRVNESGCVRRTLEEFRAEIAGEGRCPSRIHLCKGKGVRSAIAISRASPH